MIIIEVAPRTGMLSCCWVHIGRLNRNGYGRKWDGTKERMLHRMMYENTIGAIPKGLVLDHLCRNRPCCNPWHPEPVSIRVNTHRGKAILFHRKHESFH